MLFAGLIAGSIFYAGNSYGQPNQFTFEPTSIGNVSSTNYHTGVYVDTKTGTQKFQYYSSSSFTNAAIKASIPGTRHVQILNFSGFSGNFTNTTGNITAAVLINDTEGYGIGASDTYISSDSNLITVSGSSSGPVAGLLYHGGGTGASQTSAKNDGFGGNLYAENITLNVTNSDAGHAGGLLFFLDANAGTAVDINSTIRIGDMNISSTDGGATGFYAGELKKAVTIGDIDIDGKLTSSAITIGGIKNGASLKVGSIVVATSGTNANDYARGIFLEETPTGDNIDSGSIEASGTLTIDGSITVTAGGGFARGIEIEGSASNLVIKNDITADGTTDSVAVVVDGGGTITLDTTNNANLKITATSNTNDTTGILFGTVGDSVGNFDSVLNIQGAETFTNNGEKFIVDLGVDTLTKTRILNILTDTNLVTRSELNNVKTLHIATDETLTLVDNLSVGEITGGGHISTAGAVTTTTGSITGNSIVAAGNIVSAGNVLTDYGIIKANDIDAGGHVSTYTYVDGGANDLYYDITVSNNLRAAGEVNAGKLTVGDNLTQTAGIGGGHVFGFDGINVGGNLSAYGLVYTESGDIVVGGDVTVRNTTGGIAAQNEGTLAAGNFNIIADNRGNIYVTGNVDVDDSVKALGNINANSITAGNSVLTQNGGNINVIGDITATAGNVQADGNINANSITAGNSVFTQNGGNINVTGNITAGGDLGTADSTDGGNITVDGTINVGGTVYVDDDKTLSLVFANTPPRLTADELAFGTNSKLNITGYNSAAGVATPEVKIIETTNGVTSSQAIDEVLVQPLTTDYLTAVLRLDDNGKDIYAKVGLTWYSTDVNRKAHGTFTLADAETFTVGTVLGDLENNVGTNREASWDGTTLTKKGEGTLTLSGNNTYSGGTTIEAGKLVATNVNALGTGDVTNKGTLEFNLNTAGNFSQAIWGTGSVQKTGIGTLTIARANTYTGGTTIDGGEVLVQDVNALGTGAVTNNSQLTFELADGAEFKNDILGTGSVTKNLDGNLTLSGFQRYGGNTTINAGTLTVFNGNVGGDILGAGNLFVGGTFRAKSVNLGSDKVTIDAAGKLETATWTTAGKNYIFNVGGNGEIGEMVIDDKVTLGGGGADKVVLKSTGGVTTNLNKLGEKAYDAPIDLITAATDSDVSAFAFGSGNTDSWKFGLSGKDNGTNTIWQLTAESEIAVPDISSMFLTNIMGFDLPRAQNASGPWGRYKGGHLTDRLASLDDSTYQMLQIGWDKMFDAVYGGNWYAGVFMEGDWMYGRGVYRRTAADQVTQWTAGHLKSEHRGIGAGLYISRGFENNAYIDLLGRINTFGSEIKMTGLNSVVFGDTSDYHGKWTENIFAFAMEFGKTFTSKNKRWSWNPYNRILYHSAPGNDYAVQITGADSLTLNVHTNAADVWTNQLGNRLYWTSRYKGQTMGNVYAGVDYYQGISGKFGGTIQTAGSKRLQEMKMGRPKNNLAYGVGSIGGNLSPTDYIIFSMQVDLVFGDVSGYAVTLGGRYSY